MFCSLLNYQPHAVALIAALKKFRGPANPSPESQSFKVGNNPIASLDAFTRQPLALPSMSDR